MLNFVLILATIGQYFGPDEEVKTSEKVLASDSSMSMDDYFKLTEKKDKKGIDLMEISRRVFYIDSGVLARYEGKEGCYGGNDVARIYPLEGQYKGQKLYVLSKGIRSLDTAESMARLKAKREREAEEAAARQRAEAERRAMEQAERERIERERRAWVAARAARGPVDPAVVAKDLRDAISKATAASFRKKNAGIGKVALLRLAIEEVRLRHFLDREELLKISYDANITIKIDGRDYNVLGYKMK